MRRGCGMTICQLGWNSGSITLREFLPSVFFFFYFSSIKWVGSDAGVQDVLGTDEETT